MSLHLELVGDSVNEKLVDNRHNTQALRQSYTRNTRHHSAGTRVHTEINHTVMKLIVEIISNVSSSDDFGGLVDALT